MIVSQEDTLLRKNNSILELEKLVEKRRLELKQVKQENSQLRQFGVTKSQKIELLNNEINEILEDFVLLKNRKKFSKFLKRLK